MPRLRFRGLRHNGPLSWAEIRYTKKEDPMGRVLVNGLGLYLEYKRKNERNMNMLEQRFDGALFYARRRYSLSFYAT
jgi:hypothetical protein